ncbi:MAG: TRZ/ATZ family hydrolase [Gammaproteobacteria bacterium]|nr:TRZ/ATZ family hydrolase [Gammaproteobacteria bacterium]
MPQRIDAMICPRWTVAVEPDITPQRDLALAIDNGRIVALLPRAEAERRFAPDALHERPDHVLLPGLVNAHCHAGMTLFRGYADDMPLDRWLTERIWPAESKWVGPEHVRDGTRLAIAEMLRGGTTCFSDMYYFPDVVAETAIEAGIRAVVGMIAIEFPTPWAADPDEYISKGIAVHDRHRHSPLITTTFAPHAPYTVSDQTLSRIRQLADELEVPIHTHVHETAAEIAEALEKTGQRPLARLERLGLLTPALTAVHATQLLDAEIEALATAGATVVHCPRSNLKLASGACPVARLLDAGVNVALGTDGAASNNRLDLWSELSTAALFGKWVAGDATAVPAPAAIRMATINGARAVGLEHEIGSLIEGKAADLVCVEMTDFALQPVLDPLSHLVYSASRDHVSDVWVAGVHLVSQRELLRMDAEAISARAADWGRRLIEGAGT